MKIAVIGCGNIANNAHIPAYMKNPNVEIKYFCDIIPERAQAAVEKYGCGTAVTDYHEVLADPEIKAVSVCTPNNMHPVISIDAMKAGIRPGVEVGAAYSIDQLWQLVRTSEETGVPCVMNIWIPDGYKDIPADRLGPRERFKASLAILTASAATDSGERIFIFPPNPRTQEKNVGLIITLVQNSKESPWFKIVTP